MRSPPRHTSLKSDMFKAWDLAVMVQDEAPTQGVTPCFKVLYERS
jgi:hypothetical protein